MDYESFLMDEGEEIFAKSLSNEHIEAGIKIISNKMNTMFEADKHGSLWKMLKNSHEILVSEHQTRNGKNNERKSI